jgi:hypothetical protein
MPENANLIVGRVRHLAVRNILADIEPDRADEQLPAGTYTWNVQLTWPARPVDLHGWGCAKVQVGGPVITTFPGELVLDGAVSRAAVLDHLWRGLISAAEPPIPNTAEVTRLAIEPAGGA